MYTFPICNCYRRRCKTADVQLAHESIVAAAGCLQRSWSGWKIRGESCNRDVHISDLQLLQAALQNCRRSACSRKHRSRCRLLAALLEWLENPRRELYP